METAVKVFMLIGTISMTFMTMGIGLFWCLPMTIHYFRKPYLVSTSFKVCTLLFVNTIAGILMLCDN